MLFEQLDRLLDKTVVFGYDRIGYLTRRAFWNPADTDVDLTGRVCLVTGANSGLGRATAEGLAARGAQTHLVCRNAASGEQARMEIRTATGNPDVHLHLVDLSQQRAIRDFCDAFARRQSRLDVLINNAGLLLNEREVSPDGIEMSLAVNVLAGHMLIGLLLPLLKNAPQARVINVSSGGMYAVGLRTQDRQYEQEPYDGVRAYAHTKRAQVVLTELYAEHPGTEGILFFSMHPGWADTAGVQRSLPTFRMLTRPVLRTAEQGADTILWLAVRRDL
ncbi:MAG: SDR family NAD(P)-dependent oxidoreductase, partial [Leptospiraceae bacterium]|nr:SDR family NAD(P)-dependent oxidoreductase [Leptospiraceae bacterium]